MSADIGRIKDRIRKLLNLAADDGAAEGEIDNALRAARQLMLAHQLSEDDVTAPVEDLRTPEQIAADTEYGRDKSWASSPRLMQWQTMLAQTVCKFLGTVQVYRDTAKVHHKPSGVVANDGEPVRGWVFYGPRDDSILAAELHQELLMTCATAAKLKYGGALVTGPGRDYCDGFAIGLANKVFEAQQAMEQEAAKITGALQSDCRTLSVVDVARAGAIAVAKQGRASEWLKEKAGVRLRTSGGYGRQVGDSGAYETGKSDGRSQTLTKTRTARIGQG